MKSLASNHELDMYWPCMPYGPCPCGSGRKSKFCCRTGKNSWFTKPRWKNVTEITTGINQLSCFAAGTGTCSEKLSGEHYISESVLKLIGQEVKVYGLRFTDPANPQSLPTQCFTSNILCKHHNEVLSTLDLVTKNFLKTVDQFIRTLAIEPESSTSHLFLMNGNDIEYALLKMLCGLTTSGVVRGLDGRKVDSRWPQILFGHLPWPPGWGLYVEMFNPGIHSGELGSLEVGFHPNSENEVPHMGVKFASWHLVLYAGDGLHGPPSSRFRYRPDLLVTQMSDIRRGIFLSYSGESFGGGFVRQTVHSASITEPKR